MGDCHASIYMMRCLMWSGCYMISKSDSERSSSMNLCFYNECETRIPTLASHKTTMTQSSRLVSFALVCFLMRLCLSSVSSFMR